VPNDDKFHSLKGHYIRSLRVLVLTYDMSDMESFQSICKFDLNSWKEFCVFTSMPRYVIGLKSDLERKVDKEVVREWVDKENAADRIRWPDEGDSLVEWKVLEVSAKEGTGMDDLLSQVCGLSD